MMNTQPFDSCATYLKYALDLGGKKPGNLKRRPALTLSRQCGARAHTIGSKLIAALNESATKTQQPWALFDKSLVKAVLDDHDLPERIANYMPEDSSEFIRDCIEEMLGLHPDRTKLIKETSETILKILSMGNCVVVGRASAIVGRNLPSALHVRLIGSPEYRASATGKYYKLNDQQAFELMKKEDAARKRYAKYYYNQNVEDPSHYDLIINTDGFKDEAIVRMILTGLENLNK